MCVAIEDGTQIRARIPSDLKRKWDQVLDERKISHQQAQVALLAWLVEQDAIVQAMVFGQLPESQHAELATLVLKRFTAGRSKGKK